MARSGNDEPEMSWAALPTEGRLASLGWHGWHSVLHSAGVKLTLLSLHERPSAQPAFRESGLLALTILFGALGARLAYDAYSTYVLHLG